MEELKLILQHLKQPEYIHVLINPLPIFGMGIAIGLAILAVLFRNREWARASLGLVAATGLGTLAVVRYGQAAYNRVLAMSNPDAQAWLELHMVRAERWQYLFYGLAALAITTLVTDQRKRYGARALAALSSFLAIAGLVAASWIGHAGGQVRHSEFRDGPPPHHSAPNHTHEH